MAREDGQSTVELVAALPALLLAGLIALQLLATGYTLTLADGAAEAGALALASGRPAVAAVRDALPGWAADEVEVAVDGGRVTVRLRPPSPLPAVAKQLAIASAAAARPKVTSVGPVVLVTAVGSAAGSKATAAALACAASGPDRAALLIDLSGGRAPRPSLIATAAARELEERLAAHLPEAGVASRGQLCRLALPAGSTDLDGIAAALPTVRDSVAVIHLPPRLLQAILDDPRVEPSAALLCADLTADRALTALAVRDLIGRGLRVAVLKRPLGWIASRRALLGALPAGSGMLSARTRRRLLEGDPTPCL